MKKIVQLSVVFLFISTIFIPLVNPLQNDKITISTIGQHESFISQYNNSLIKYTFQGFSYTKEIINISLSEKEYLKKKLMDIELTSLPRNEKNVIIKKLINEYGFFTHQTNPSNILIQQKQLPGILLNNHNNDETSKKLFFSRVTGTFGPSIINLAHIARVSVMFISIAKGVDFEIVNFPGRTTFQSDNLVKFVAYGVFGTILIMPFYSPFGYIDASVLWGKIKEKRTNSGEIEDFKVQDRIQI